MIKEIIVSVLVSALVGAGIVLLTPRGSTGDLGGTRMENGISADSIEPSAGEVRGTTLTVTGASTLGGNLTITSSNTATSTASVGCVQTSATSTATPVKLVLGKVGSSATTTLYNTSSGAVYWAYGNCP